MVTKSKSKQTLFETRIDISQNHRTALVELLNQNLADVFDLYSQTKQAHWNVKGKDFYQLHLLFDQLAEEVFPFVDLIAERVTVLGGLAHGTARMAAASSRVPEFPEAVNGMECVSALAERYAAAGQAARQAISEAEEHQDMDTADLFTDVSRTLDKSLWFLEAHLQGDR